ncbi:hypothetical protein [uncultured Hymenobacter sp.]|uniref:hypothetical protein n=1 Tax=uncultured Hymenobacter sp. TaxID=170016 RepID=UPI0035C9988C
MLPQLAKYASVFLISMVKFVGGPLAGASLGLGFAETLGLTVAGMMTTVILLSGVGRRWVRHRQQQRRLRHEKVFSRRSRTIVRVFQRFGMPGLALFTPILFTPIGGTVVATLLGVPRPRILLHMLWSALLWGVTLTLLSDELAHWLHR